MSFPAPVCVSYHALPASRRPRRSRPLRFNANSAAYIKDIYSKLGLPSDTTTGRHFYPERNIYNSRQELVRIDHMFSEKFSIWGRYLNDNIPTIEPGGLFQAR